MRLVTAFVLVACLPSASLGAPVPPRDERKEQPHAIEVIQKLGGDVLYDYQQPKLRHLNLRRTAVTHRLPGVSTVSSANTNLSRSVKKRIASS